MINVSLISLDDLASYVNRSNPQRPRQIAPIKVEGTDYYIPDHNTMALSGLTRANGVFYTNWLIAARRLLLSRIAARSSPAVASPPLREASCRTSAVSAPSPTPMVIST